MCIRDSAQTAQQKALAARQLLAAYDPNRPLRQGYALVRAGSNLVKQAAQLQAGFEIEVEFIDGKVASQVKQVTMKEKK